MGGEKDTCSGCGCCCKGKNKVAPEANSDQTEVPFNSIERINGWSCPLHPLQITAWLFIMIFGIIHFGILVNYLPEKWKAAGYIVSFHKKGIVSLCFHCNLILV